MQSKTDYKSYNRKGDEIFEVESEEINDMIKIRYRQLRKKVLNMDYFNNLLDNYIVKLSKGAVERDSRLWYNYNAIEEIENIRVWISRRINYYDEYIGVNNES